MILMIFIITGTQILNNVSLPKSNPDSSCNENQNYGLPILIVGMSLTCEALDVYEK